jgi:hypothetical protein
VLRISIPVLVLACLTPLCAQALPAVGGGGGMFVTGARLLEMCKTNSPYCTGYVAGIADALTPLSEAGGPLPPNSLASFCAQGLTVKQIIIEFRKFMKSNPEGAQTNAAQLVGDALHMAYPCVRPQK